MASAFLFITLFVFYDGALGLNLLVIFARVGGTYGDFFDVTVEGGKPVQEGICGCCL